MSESLKIKGILSFPFLLKKRPDEEKFDTMLIFSKKDEAQVNRIKQAIDAAAEAKHGKSTQGSFTNPVKDGDEVVGKEGMEGMEGNWFINLRTDVKPGIIDTDGNECTRLDVYGGQKVVVTCHMYGYDFKGKGVACELHNVLVLGGGEHFGGGGREATSAEDDFADYMGDGDKAGAGAEKGGW